MNLNAKTEYACLAMLELAQHFEGGELVQATSAILPIGEEDLAISTNLTYISLVLAQGIYLLILVSFHSMCDREA